LLSQSKITSEEIREVFKILSDKDVSESVLDEQLVRLSGMSVKEKGTAGVRNSSSDSGSSSSSEVSPIPPSKEIKRADSTWWNPFSALPTTEAGKLPAGAPSTVVSNPVFSPFESPAFGSPQLPPDASENLKGLLRAWYWAGYYTAKYEIEEP
jgi:hypothetical protein